MGTAVWLFLSALFSGGASLLFMKESLAEDSPSISFWAFILLLIFAMGTGVTSGSLVESEWQQFLEIQEEIAESE